MSIKSNLRSRQGWLLGLLAAAALGGWAARSHAQNHSDSNSSPTKLTAFDQRALKQARQAVLEGRKTCRFDSFGDEEFWGGKLLLHQAIQGSQLGGVGAGISPNAALNLGLKVDVEALPPSLVHGIQAKQVNLDDPATTVALLKLNAVVGLKGIFTGNHLTSVGITCALCHSTVDNSFTFGVGHRLDGWANRDLDVGKIIAAAPDLSPFKARRRSVQWQGQVQRLPLRSTVDGSRLEPAQT